jgi:hypothetical protein
MSTTFGLVLSGKPGEHLADVLGSQEPNPVVLLAVPLPPAAKKDIVYFKKFGMPGLAISKEVFG